MVFAALKEVRWGRENPGGNGFHQNRLESIQGSKQDELCLLKTDKYKFGRRALFTSGSSLCEGLASCALQN